MGIRVNVSMSGLGFAAAGVEALARVMQGETLAAERLLALSNAEAPLEIGTLIGSSTVIPATDPTEGAAVTYDTPYAARLHEHPEYQFQNGRKGKYLEDPAVENRGELGDIIRKQVRGG
jgi:hypothetical protein